MRAVQRRCTNPLPLPPLIRRVAAVCALGLFLWLNLLLVFPHLHLGTCGHDAHSEQHRCAVTLFAKGLVDAPPATVIVEAPAVVSLYTAPLPSPMLATADVVPPPGRAPPLRAA